VQTGESSADDFLLFWCMDAKKQILVLVSNFVNLNLFKERSCVLC
jgi:hypothetical protein